MRALHVRHTIHNVYQRNSAIQLTSMGLTYACPNNYVLVVVVVAFQFQSSRIRMDIVVVIVLVGVAGT